MRRLRLALEWAAVPFLLVQIVWLEARMEREHARKRREVARRAAEAYDARRRWRPYL